MAELLKQYQTLLDYEKDNVCKVLEEQVEINKDNFICPHTKVSLAVPCSLKECFYYIEKDWQKNCVLNYMHDQSVDKLSPTEMSFLYGVSLDEIKRLYEKHMTVMRKKFLKQQLEGENEITYLNNIPICCVCESKTNSTINIQGLTFCGKKCIKDKPLYVFVIEKEYCSDIHTILKIAFKCFKSLDIIERILDISRKKLEYMINKFAKDLMKNFIALTNTNELFSRKERKSKLCEKSLSRMRKGLHQFGSPKKSLKVIYSKFCEGLKQI